MCRLKLRGVMSPTLHNTSPSGSTAALRLVPFARKAAEDALVAVGTAGDDVAQLLTRAKLLIEPEEK